jgi:HPt (histidine-containing phosphotransfer) domain-containing protein
MRDQLFSAKLAAAGCGFAERMREDAAALALLGEKLQAQADASDVLEPLQKCAHKLAGAAGVFDFPEVSEAAAMLEDAVIERRSGKRNPGRVESSIGALLKLIACV